MTLVLAVMFVVLLAMGSPIFVAIGLSSIIALLVAGSGIPDTLAITRLFGGLDKFAVMALPFYIFAANIMDVGGLSEKIVDWARALVKGVVGGLAVAMQVACMAFGALSGSCPATVIAIGRLMAPRLVKEGYDPGFIAGALVSGSAVASIIPPSITMMLFAASTGASTGALFIGGVVPGLLFGALLIMYSMWYAKKNNIQSSAVAAGDGGDDISFLTATRRASWALGVPLIIIGGIYLGIVTPTEAAGLSAVYALFVGTVIYKQITWKGFLTICEKSVEVIAQVMILIAVASIFAWLLTVVQLPQQLANIVTASASVVIFLLLMNGILLIAGMFMDPNSLVIILGPIFYQIGTAMGLTATHIGIVVTVNLAIGMFTPPFGLNLFVAQTVVKQPMAFIYKSAIPFVVLCIASLLLITFIPQLTEWLPSLVFKGGI